MTSELPSGRGLPQELIDIIIDHLYDDTNALISCAQACRSLNLSSQHHLARRRAHIRLPSRSGTQDKTKEDHHSLLSCCSSPQAHAVRELIVQQTGGELLDDTRVDMRADEALHADLCQTLRALPELTILKLSGLRLARQPRSAGGAGFPWAILELPHLRELHLVSLTFDNFWCHTLAPAQRERLAPALERFTVRRCNLASPALKEIVNTLCDTKAASPAVAPLRALDIAVSLYNGASGGVSPAVRLLQTVAHSLDHLGLEFFANPSPQTTMFNTTEYSSLLDGVAGCAHLRSLSLAFNDARALPSMCHVLEELLTKVLEHTAVAHLDFAICISHAHSLPTAALEKLQGVVCGFSQVEAVTIRPYDLRGDMAGVQTDMQLLSDSLLLFHQRGLLHVDPRAVLP